MAEVKTECAVYGEGTVLPVKIARDAKVSALQEAIFYKERYNYQYNFDSSALTLYLAQKDGEWLKHDDSVEDFLQGKIDTAYKKMLSSMKLNKPAYFGDFQLGEEEIHVLVELPTQKTHDSSFTFREASVRQMRLEMLLEEHLAALPHKKLKSYSDAELGQIESARLKKDELIVDAPLTENGEAFWSQEIQNQVNAIENEAIFDAFITPFFNDVLASCGMVFVNNERYQWLCQSPLVTKSTDLKPDGFATHPGMFRAKQEPNDSVHRPNGFRFGVAEEELFDCLILFESNLTITDRAFGQVVRYLQNLSPEASASAILFDLHSFWLVKTYKSVVVKVQKAMWIKKGSKSLFQYFIIDNMSPWVTRLTSACSLLGVDVKDGDAFLGRGAHGRVFKVVWQGREVFALKIVETSSVGRLYQEEKTLTKAQHTGLTISPVGQCVEIHDGAALLLSPAGKPLPQPATRQEVENLFELLWQLHENGLVHGDPRVPNVILNGEKPLWIDLVEVMEANPTLKRFDAGILTRSILSFSRTVLLKPVLKQLIDNYGKSATRENLNHLVEIVCQSLGFSN